MDLEGKSVVQVQCGIVYWLGGRIVDDPMPQEGVDAICEIGRNLNLA